MSTDNNGESKDDEKREAREGVIVDHIFRQLRRHFDENIRGKKQISIQPAEQAIIFDFANTSIRNGAAAAVVSLVLLRKLRAAMMRRIYAHVSKQYDNATSSSSSTNQPPPSFTKVASPTNPFGSQATGNIDKSAAIEPRRIHPITHMFGWVVDTFICLSIGGTVSVLTANPYRTVERIAKIPLLPGQSSFCDELCPALVDEWTKLVNQANDKYNNDTSATAADQYAVDSYNDSDESVIDKNNATNMNKRVDSVLHPDLLAKPQSLTLKAFSDMTLNCRKRSAYQQQLKSKYIPEPGVPENIPITDYDVHNDAIDLEFFDPSVQAEAQEWADAMVQDQNERKK